MAFTRFEKWLADQENRGRKFTDERRQWLTAIRDHIAASVSIEPDDLELSPFSQWGGLGKDHRNPRTRERTSRQSAATEDAESVVW
jgi:hypothetical protein